MTTFEGRTAVVTGGASGIGLAIAQAFAAGATLLAFGHPRTAAPLSFTSPWPADLTGWLETLRRLG